MHIFFGLANIRPLFNNLRRQAHRQIAWQRHIVQLKCFRRLIRGQSAEQRRQGIARLTQLLLQRRQRLRGLCLQGLLGEHVQIAGGAQQPLMLHLVGQLMLQFEQPLASRRSGRAAIPPAPP